MIRYLLPLFALLAAGTAQAQFRWTNDLETGLSEARDRQAPILAFFWDHN